MLDVDCSYSCLVGPRSVIIFFVHVWLRILFFVIYKLIYVIFSLFFDIHHYVAILDAHRCLSLKRRRKGSNSWPWGWFPTILPLGKYFGCYFPFSLNPLNFYFSWHSYIFMYIVIVHCNLLCGFLVYFHLLSIYAINMAL